MWGVLLVLGVGGATLRCGFPEFGGFESSAGGAAWGGEGGAGGGAQGGDAGTSEGGMGGGVGGGVETGGDAGGGAGGESGAGGASGGAGGGGQGGTELGGQGGSESGGQSGGGGSGELLNAWHIPTNAEPPSVTMRNPRFPAASALGYVYFGVQPAGSASGGTLHWWWTGETMPHTAQFQWDSQNGGNDYWVSTFQMPARPIGVFHYYVEVTPASADFAVTFLYGTDSSTNATRESDLARSEPYAPDVRPPTTGEVVVSEIMINALGTSEAAKEWFEVYCAASVPVTLHGCRVADNLDANMHVISNEELVLWPGVYATFGASSDIAQLEGFVPDYAYGSGMQFNNTTGDSVRVLLPTMQLIDVVAWTQTWPVIEGHSMQLRTSPPNATANDVSANWCASANAYGLPTYGSSYGTPNLPNDC